MGFLDEVRDTIRDSPVAKAAGATRYGQGEDPYIRALQNAKELGYPLPGSAEDVGQAQRYNATNLAANRWGGAPLITNALHELLLSPFAEGEGGPNWDRWKAGNRGVWDWFKGQGASAGSAPSQLPRRIR